jgi:hypothetical protein
MSGCLRALGRRPLQDNLEVHTERLGDLARPGSAAVVRSSSAAAWQIIAESERRLRGTRIAPVRSLQCHSTSPVRVGAAPYPHSQPRVLSPQFNTYSPATSPSP